MTRSAQYVPARSWARMRTERPPGNALPHRAYSVEWIVRTVRRWRPCLIQIMALAVSQSWAWTMSNGPQVSSTTKTRSTNARHMLLTSSTNSEWAGYGHRSYWTPSISSWYFWPGAMRVKTWTSCPMRANAAPSSLTWAATPPTATE